MSSISVVTSLPYFTLLCTQGVPACRVQPTRRLRPPFMSQGLGGGGAWEEQWIGPSPPAVVSSGRPAAIESLARGESVILLPGVASEAQCLELLAAARAAAERERVATRAPLARRLADKMVRLSTAAASPAAAPPAVAGVASRPRGTSPRAPTPGTSRRATRCWATIRRGCCRRAPTPTARPRTSALRQAA